MNRKLLILVVAIALALMLPGAVMAQSPGGLSYWSGVQVQNLDASDATIGLTFYNQDGSVAFTAADTVPGSSSVNYFPLDPALTGFNGSLVISSDKPVTAIANTSSTDFKYGAATTSFSAGATDIKLPLIMCNNSGFNTWFNVQNTGASDASITINYTPGSDGLPGSENAVIKAGAALTFDQASGSSTLNCDALGNPKFIGSASVTSNQPIVATVMELNTTTFATLFGYNSFSAGSTTVVAPLLMANNSGFWSSLNIQNVGASQTTVTAAYTPNQDPGGWQPADEQCVLDPGEACNLIQAGGQWTQRYVGGATVSASEDIAVIVNQHRQKAGALGPFGASYEGFEGSAGTANISAPLIMASNNGFWTSINVMNLGANCPVVNIDYGDNIVGAWNPLPETFSLDAGEAYSVLQNGTAGSGNNSVNDWNTRYVGSAEVSGSGCDLVAVVNELRLGSGDSFYTYNGYNYVPSP